MGTLEKRKTTGWEREGGEVRAAITETWRGGGESKKKKQQNPEVVSVAFISKKYIAVPLTLHASLAHVPGEGLHFTKEVMQTCLHLVTMDMALCETKPPICIANNQEQ